VGVASVFGLLIGLSYTEMSAADIQLTLVGLLLCLGLVAIGGLLSRINI
jgi:uncharacterized MnhB-related membrane protein